jgi:hypothetical protein
VSEPQAGHPTVFPLTGEIIALQVVHASPVERVPALTNMHCGLLRHNGLTDWRGPAKQLCKLGSEVARLLSGCGGRSSETK